MRSRIERLRRYIVTAETAQYRLFVWLVYPVLPDKNLIVMPREDDLMFGLLHSRFHAAWARRKGSDLEDRPRYTHTTTFATFPFPAGMTPDIDPANARALPRQRRSRTAAARLDALRNAWLYPEDLLVRVAGGSAGFSGSSAAARRRRCANAGARTLTASITRLPTGLPKRTAPSMRG